ncbi:MAG TPA: DnaJ domain-containing protein [Burkholderiales bacterium]|jgi:curved DNA-binding protein CbpA|nr:DnaJ domain-containing protein [Burkholderiales bacterium]
MKKTLYQILGVDPKASAQDVAAAYSKRLEEVSTATIRDPNKLVVLQQAKEILSDANQRAAYDASLTGRVARAPVEAVDEREPAFLQVWGKWIVVSVVLIVVGVWWAKRVAPPPAQNTPPPQVASRTLEPSQPVEPAEQPANPDDAKETAPPVAAVQPQDDSPASPILGQWPCHDSISGRSSQYNFQPDGTLNIATTDGQVLTLNYGVSGKVLKLTGPNQASTFMIEELTARKMILNTGVEGRREVCER